MDVAGWDTAAETVESSCAVGVAAGLHFAVSDAVAEVAIGPCSDSAILHLACFDSLADAEVAMQSWLAVAK